MEKYKPSYVSNAIRTPDGTIICSRFRHDYQTYVDANGKEYMVDGGLDYLRRSVVDDAPYEELSVPSSAPFETIREALEWGTYGKDGKDPLRYVKISQMADDHIAKVIEMLRVAAQREASRKTMSPALEIPYEFRESVGLPSNRKQEPEEKQPDSWLVEYFNEELKYRQEHGISIGETVPVV